MAGTRVLTTIMAFLPGVSPVYHDVLLLRGLLENIMAARIYRELKFGLLPEHATSVAACESNLTVIRFRLPTSVMSEFHASGISINEQAAMESGSGSDES